MRFVPKITAIYGNFIETQRLTRPTQGLQIRGQIAHHWLATLSCSSDERVHTVCGCCNPASPFLGPRNRHKSLREELSHSDSFAVVEHPPNPAPVS